MEVATVHVTLYSEPRWPATRQLLCAGPRYADARALGGLPTASTAKEQKDSQLLAGRGMAAVRTDAGRKMLAPFFFIGQHVTVLPPTGRSVLAGQGARREARHFNISSSTSRLDRRSVKYGV